MSQHKKGHSGHGLVFFHDILQLIWSALDQLFEPNKGDGSRGLLEADGYPSRRQNVAMGRPLQMVFNGKIDENKHVTVEIK